jgi:hypothetical protein
MVGTRNNKIKYKVIGDKGKKAKTKNCTGYIKVKNVPLRMIGIYFKR